MDNHYKSINRILIRGWLLIAAILFVSYLGEVAKGERTVGYFISFSIVTAIPPLICYCLYKKNPDMEKLRYCIVAGYFPMYLFVMVTGSTSMVFCYILPMLSLLVLYHQPKLILYTGIASLAINGASVLKKILNGTMTLSQTKDGEIQIALLFLCFLGAYIATKLYDGITKENESYIHILDEKNTQIQKMALQTITTIANTIDAKDTYTKGHSKRVSEYSAAIAAAMGMSDKEVNDIRSIALLHDIGKIAVPDSVLNKPGRLTNEEFALMKQHTVRGAEILKDIVMIPGISVGAKYHHEKYDGSGYPEGLSGEDIPLVARIIAVADAYDAMNSNRIYRKHLTEEHIMGELERCSGTQFDPDIAKAFVELLRSGKMADMRLENEGEDENVRILSRIMEKQEEKYRESSRTDELTGLLNRTSGDKLMKEAAEKGTGCFVLIDLDNFKHFNVNYGFVTGDMIIRAVAECIDSIDEEKITSRFGGDEFALFLSGISTEKRIYELMDSLMDSIDLRIKELFPNDKLTVSAGIAMADKPHESFYDLLAYADKALYAAQQSDNRYILFRHSNAYSERSSSVDLTQLVEHIVNEGGYSGGFQIDYPEFSGIYNLIKKIAERNKQPIQLIMFTLEENEGVSISVEERDRVMDLLEGAIVGAIRGVDVTTRFSSTQRLVLLLNTSSENVEIVTTRIMLEFYKMYGSKEVSIHYDMALIPTGGSADKPQILSQNKPQ